MDIQAYLTSLPLQDTASLPLGAIFWANHLYEVVEVDMEGYSRARQWRKDQHSDVALIPNSSLAHRLPLIVRGRILPVFATREALLNELRQPISFVFPDEQLAIDAAYLDVGLCGKSSGLYLRRHTAFPAFEVTNGLIVLRSYFFMRTKANFDTNLTELKARLQNRLIPHTFGAPYWRLLSSWNADPYNTEQTVAMRPIQVDITQE